MSNKTTVRNLLAAVLTAIFSVTLADAVFHISKMIEIGKDISFKITLP